jgi:hypothetical protein
MFHQPLRQTKQLLGSLLDLMGIDLPVLDHTTISRRAARLTPVLHTAQPDGPVVWNLINIFRFDQEVRLIEEWARTDNRSFLRQMRAEGL